MSVVERLRQGLRRTAKEWARRLDSLSVKEGSSDAGATVDPESVELLEELLIEADVGLVATKTILERVSKTSSQARSSLRTRVQAEILNILTGPKHESYQNAVLNVVLVVGVNGTGKTTTVGKLAELWRSE